MISQEDIDRKYIFIDRVYKYREGIPQFFKFPRFVLACLCVIINTQLQMAEKSEK